MELHGTSSVNERGVLEIGGCTVDDLAATYGTPLILYDVEQIRERIRAYWKSLLSFQVPYVLAYASKAFSCKAMCRLANEEAMWLDVVSGGELHTALAADFPPERIYMHGNNKSSDELEYAIMSGIHHIVIDNFDEIDRMVEILRKRNTSMRVVLRITPGVDAHTHEFITTGTQDSKFGFDLFSGQADEAASLVLKQEHLILIGLHMHIGSQIFEADGFHIASERMAQLYSRIKVNCDTLEWFNMGGGLGIRYTKEDRLPPLEQAVKGLIEGAKRAFERVGLVLPKLMIEPGRSIVAEAGTTIYRVGSRKSVPNVRDYIAIDGGMTDNPRLALYGAVYEACIANRMFDESKQTVSVAGKCCESGDMILWDALLPEPHPGDLLAVSCTGAYNYSMASNYNRLPRPAVVFVERGEARLVIRRETYSDVCSLDL
ncbi:diaminopimelate decarboxylase [Ferroacidibacillus organovorans]|uniref:Diaminopimelate decarboxylase n=1 Tax=Ferroacidibacillus organovorans TaxID=1765683 RepID=A0A853KGX5_9BACL|nr:diaminopimelate decarboxylase [Ferroacidibacillus organovorans]KYP80443.1 diaminopimelate decarboxylase [Ferroacidibacillus organovorans]OAG94670.1 diaminopimelate decarboxylase [Ferroacidibacillus organovorans]